MEQKHACPRSPGTAPHPLTSGTSPGSSELSCQGRERGSEVEETRDEGRGGGDAMAGGLPWGPSIEGGLFSKATSRLGWASSVGPIWLSLSQGRGSAILTRMRSQGQGGLGGRGMSPLPLPA